MPCSITQDCQAITYGRGSGTGAQELLSAQERGDIYKRCTYIYLYVYIYIDIYIYIKYKCYILYILNIYLYIILHYIVLYYTYTCSFARWMDDEPPSPYRSWLVKRRVFKLKGTQFQIKFLPALQQEYQRTVSDAAALTTFQTQTFPCISKPFTW